ncbi:MAG: LysR family transcriptional regulator [Hyphomonas sp.]|nr:LysR family transcriptional regulator [Hyphomonas sp.]
MIDVEVARTFLAVIETGTFQGAAGKVNVTQSTVSARIRTLEERLGVSVFTRSKSGAELTANGRHFERYARAIVRGWEQGRYQAGLPERFDELLVVGGQYNLWARLLSNWLNEMRAALPSVAFRAEAGSPLHLSQLLSEGLVDIAVLHHPRFRPDIDVELLMEDELILVTADPEGAFEDRYVFVDWGEAFRDMHAQGVVSGK